MFTQQTGYATPKVGVRGAVFRDDRILLVRETADEHRWTLPGGWADVNESPSRGRRQGSARGGWISRCVRSSSPPCGTGLVTRTEWCNRSTFGGCSSCARSLAVSRKRDRRRARWLSSRSTSCRPSYRPAGSCFLTTEAHVRTHAPTGPANRLRLSTIAGAAHVRRLGQSQVQSYPRNAIGRSMLAISAGSISPASNRPRIRSVVVAAGAMALTRIFCGAHSTAIDRVIAAMRPFQPSDRLAIGIVTPFIVDWRRHQASAFRKGLSERS